MSKQNLPGFKSSQRKRDVLEHAQQIFTNSVGIDYIDPDGLKGAQREQVKAAARSAIQLADIFDDEAEAWMQK
jgi:hypothetical protein